MQAFILSVPLSIELSLINALFFLRRISESLRCEVFMWNDDCDITPLYLLLERKRGKTEQIFARKSINYGVFSFMSIAQITIIYIHSNEMSLSSRIARFKDKWKKSSTKVYTTKRKTKNKSNSSHKSVKIWHLFGNIHGYINGSHSVSVRKKNVFFYWKPFTRTINLL